MAKPITIKIVGDDKGFKQTMGSVEGSIGKMTSSVGKMAAAVGGALAAAGVVKFGTDAVNLASDLEEAAGAAETIFGGAFERVETALQDSATAMGLNRAEAFDLANGIGVLFKNVSDAERATIALDLAARAADIGSMFNEEPDKAAEALTAALNGSSETVRRFGIDTSDAAIQQYALENGIKGVDGKLSEAEKKMIRYEIIMRDSAIAAGNFADTSDGLANQTRIASARFEELQARLGEKLLPVVSRVAEVILDDLFPAAERIGGYLSRTFGPIIDRIASFFRRDLIPAFKGFSDTTNKDVHPIVVRLRDLFNNGLKPAIDAIARFVKRDLVPALRELWRMFNTYIRPVLERYIIPIMLRFASFMLGRVVPAVMRVAGVLLRSGVASLRAFFTALSTVVGWVQRVIDIFNRIVSVIAGLPSRIRSAARGLWDGIPRPPSWLTNPTGAVSSVIGRLNPFQHGGRHTGGLALVGERGPEVVHLPRGSEVIPNHSLDRAGMGSVVVNVHTSADPWQIGHEVAWAIRTGSR